MKRAIALALGLALVGGASYAQTNQVLSRNAVGYEKLTIPPRGNGFKLTRLDFIGLGGSITYSNLIGDQLPNGSQIIRFDKASQQYIISQKALGNFPLSVRTAVVDTAVGFFLVGGTNVGQTNYTVYFMGEVPDAITQPTNTEFGIGGPSTPFQMLGYPYPTAITWSNVTLLSALSNGSQIITYDGNNYLIRQKALGNFPLALRTNVLQPGEGFFVKTTQSVNWVEVKPYTWP